MGVWRTTTQTPCGSATRSRSSAPRASGSWNRGLPAKKQHRREARVVVRSDVNELLARGPAATPFDIMRAGYAELMVTDLDASERFYVELLGLVVSARTDD